MSEKKVIFISGGAKNIGACIARIFHDRDFDVIVHYHRSKKAAEHLVTDLNRLRSGSAEALQADLTDAAQLASLARQLPALFGRLDVLVNNASAFYPTPYGEVDSAQWDELIDSNLRAAFFLTQNLRDELACRQGVVINIVDTHADKPLAGHSVYSIAKAGLKAMTRALAQELAPQVRVNGVSPGAISWPPALSDEQDPEVLRRREQILQQVPLGHLGKPQDIADAVFFLVNEASYMSGQVIRVDGGRHLS